MRQIIIVSHGELANGFVNAAKLIMGEADILALCAYTDENIPYEEIILRKVEELNAGDEMIILTDLLGGSVNNHLMELTTRDHVHLVTGINLGLILQLLASSEDADTESFIENLIHDARDGMVYCNQIILDTVDEEL